MDGYRPDDEPVLQGESQRWAVRVEYLGTSYCGWQFQDHCVSVQSVLEEALSQVANHPVATVCAGRTDTGVHATHQVVHFDTQAKRSERSWIMGCNRYLPVDVSVVWAKPVSADFHARYEAIQRQYRYVIWNRFTASGVLAAGTTHVASPLDHERMHEAAQVLLGEQDFSSFRAAHCQSRSPCRRLDWIRVSRQTDSVLVDIAANAFLYHMVRNVVGSLIEVGTERQSVDWLQWLLQQRNRTLAAATAPAQGLYLTGVRYPQLLPTQIDRPFDESFDRP